MLELRDLRIWLPRRGLAAELGLTAEAGSVTALVGPGGRGTSTVLALLAGRPLSGARIEGEALLDGRSLLAAPPSDVAARVQLFARRPDDPTPVGALLEHHGATPADYGLADVAPRPVTSLPPDLAARAQVALIEHAPHRQVLLVDQPTSPLEPEWRERLGAAMRRHARRGSTVIWAEHQLDAVWAYADAIAEQGRPTVAIDQWQPDTVREPTLKTLSRVLRTPPSAAHSPSSIAATAPPLRAASSTRPPRGARSVTVSLSEVGLGGTSDLELSPTETLGVVALTGRAEPVARRLTAALGGARVPSVLPAESSPIELTRRWDALHGTSATAGLPELVGLRPGRPLAEHSDGEVASLRTLLAATGTRPVWLPHPQVGLDQARQISLQRDLFAGHRAQRIVTSRDLEFLVRACSALLLLDGDEVVAFGSPSAVARHLPHGTLTSEALPGSGALRLGDVLESLGAIA